LSRTYDDASDKNDQFSSYSYDVRDLVEQVKNAKTAADVSPKVTSYTHTSRGETDVETKANGNTVDYDYFLNGLVRQQVEKKSNGTLVSSHVMDYSANGDRVKDTARVQNADNHAAYLDNVFAYTYDPRDRVAKVEKKDAAGSTVLSTELYKHDANGNVVDQTVNSVQTTYTYDRNRLLSAVSGTSTASYDYDPFGRLQQVLSGVGAAKKVIERNTYDGYDRVVKHRALQPDGSTKTTDTSYDALDRTASQTEDAGTASAKTTDFNYLGLSGEVLSEEVAGKVTASYQYSPWGSRLSQVKFKTDGTSEDAYYGYNPHTDVESLTGTDGDTKATYGYTAYGKDDESRFTGADKPDAQQPGKEPYNVYRFNAKRWDRSSGSYDMGFRAYSPGLNRFLTRDSYNGALSDLGLGLDPWTSSRYAFGGGNPISRIELDGHCAVDDDEARCGIEAHRTSYSGEDPTEAYAEPVSTQPEQPSRGDRFGRWLAEKPLTQRISEEMVVKPVQNTYEACKAAVQNPANGDLKALCNMNLGLMALGFTPVGKGVGVLTRKGMEAAAERATATARWFGAAETTVEHTAAKAAAAPVPKFSNYIFKPGATHGKDAVFRGLGYNREDSASLAKLYEEQAAAKYAARDYTYGKLDQYGQRIDIEIELPGIGSAAGRTSYLRSGWMIQ
jgi:RHS repeat-associated protein